jgi:Raf kinase inhibitor-like YbhB/YbcL family protein
VRRPLLLLVAIAIALVGGACSSEPDPTEANVDGGFNLTSTAFDEGDQIPPAHALDGENQSPPLAWSGVPDGTAELALTVTDPDASNFVHWVVWGIDPADGAVLAGAVPTGATVGLNQFGEPEWAGPAPPAGEEHTYVFRLHALERPVTIDESTPAAEALSAIEEQTFQTADLRAQFESG